MSYEHPRRLFASLNPTHTQWINFSYHCPINPSLIPPRQNRSLLKHPYHSSPVLECYQMHWVFFSERVICLSLNIPAKLRADHLSC